MAKGGNSICPSTDERINKIWHTRTMESYSALIRNEILILAIIYMNLVNMPGDINYTKMANIV